MKAFQKEGTVLEYGKDINSKLLTDNGQFVMLWLLKSVTDKSGNYLEYKYSFACNCICNSTCNFI